MFSDETNAGIGAEQNQQAGQHAPGLTVADLIPPAATGDEALKEKEFTLQELNAEIENVEARQEAEDAELAEKQRRHDSLDAQIAEKRKQLAQLTAASSTKAHYPDTHIHRDPPVPEESHDVPAHVHIDGRGQIFDPEFHAMDGDKPYRDSAGMFVAKDKHYAPKTGVADFVKP